MVRVLTNHRLTGFSVIACNSKSFAPLLDVSPKTMAHLFDVAEKVYTILAHIGCNRYCIKRQGFKKSFRILIGRIADIAAFCIGNGKMFFANITNRFFHGFPPSQPSAS